MHSGSTQQQKTTRRSSRGGMIALLCILSLSAASLQAQTPSQPQRPPSKPQPVAPPRAPAPAPAPEAAPAPAPPQPSLPPLDTLDRQERRALLRHCAQEWEEVKRVGRAAGHSWKEFFESCRLKVSRQ